MVINGLIAAASAWQLAAPLPFIRNHDTTLPHDRWSYYYYHYHYYYHFYSIFHLLRAPIRILSYSDQ